MKYHFHLYRSQIMEFIQIPKLLYIDYSQVDLTSDEREKMADAFSALKVAKHLLSPFKSRIDRYFIGTDLSTFPQHLYYYLLENGQDPQDMDDFCKAILLLPEDLLKRRLVKAILDSEELLSIEDFVLALEEKDLSDQSRWQIFWAYCHIQECVQGLVDLYYELVPLYQPIYQPFKQEIVRFGQDFDLESIYAEVGHDILGMVKQTGKTDCQVFVQSPLFFIQGYIFDEKNSKSPLYYFIYPRVTIFVNRVKRISIDSLTLMLKVLGDSVRYDILKRLTQTDQKSKKIAEELGITPANVTFHSQKLLNANLILFATDNSEVKYSLNKPLLRQLLEQLKQDFEL